MYTLIGGIIFLLHVVVIDAQLYPAQIQSRIFQARSEIAGNHMLFKSQNSLQRGEVALQTARSTNSLQEKAIVKDLLLKGQLDEIKRLSEYLSGTDASSCTNGSLQETKDVLSTCRTEFQHCTNKNMTTLEGMLNLLYQLEILYRGIVDRAPSTIDLCASEAMGKHNKVEVAKACIDEFLENFYNATFNFEEILFFVEGHIQEAVTIIPTCTNITRSRATFSVNAILESIRVCAERYKEQVEVKSFPDYKDSLSVCVRYTSLFDASVCEYANVGLMKSASMLIHALKKIYEMGKEATMRYIVDAAAQQFSRELRIIKNATLIRDLTPKQNVCVATAAGDMKNAIHKAGTGWVKCVSSTSQNIYQVLVAAENLNITINKRLQSDGMEALMKCITHHMASGEAAARCCTQTYAKFEDYVQKMYRLLNNTFKNHVTPAAKCGIVFQNSVQAKADRILATLGDCVPQVVSLIELSLNSTTHTASLELPTFLIYNHDNMTEYFWIR